MTPVDSSPTPEARMLERAEWLHSLSRRERDELFELPLREVDERFARWLSDARPGRAPLP